MKKLLLIFKKNLKLTSFEYEQLKKSRKNIYYNIFRNWDSLNHVKILLNIEKNFKIKINSLNVKKLNNYKSIKSFLKNK
jgi:acyl carrier protein